MNNSWMDQLCSEPLAHSESKWFPAALWEWNTWKHLWRRKRAHAFACTSLGGAVSFKTFSIEKTDRKQSLCEKIYAPGHIKTLGCHPPGPEKHHWAFNPACLRAALNGRIINEHEYRFHADTWWKRSLTKIEKKWRVSLNLRAY